MRRNGSPVPHISHDFALDILNLVAARLREAQESVTNRRVAIVEADGGLHALKARLREEDETRLAKLMLYLTSIWTIYKSSQPRNLMIDREKL